MWRERKLKNSKKRGKQQEETKSGIINYITCNNCEGRRYRQSGRHLQIQNCNHYPDRRAHKIPDSTVVHVAESGYLRNWREPEILNSGMVKKMWKLTEAAHII